MQILFIVYLILAAEMVLSLTYSISYSIVTITTIATEGGERDWHLGLHEDLARIHRSFRRRIVYQRDVQPGQTTLGKTKCDLDLRLHTKFGRRCL